MQSQPVRLPDPPPVKHPSLLRLHAGSSFLFVLLLAAAPARAQVAPAPAEQSSTSADVQQAQFVQKPKELYRRDVGLSGFGQDTNVTNGNSLRSDTTSSGGGLLSFRQSARWWAGYEVNYGYTRFTDAYYFGGYRVKHNTNELSAAYLLKSAAYKGVYVFGSFGVGILSLSPTQYGGALKPISVAPATQTLPSFVYSVGVEKQLTEHIGIRVQYRADEAKDPDFKQEALNTHKLRTMKEPGIGVYYRF